MPHGQAVALFGLGRVVAWSAVFDSFSRLKSLHPIISDLLRSVSRRVAFPPPLMNAYDGCHITIQVPVDFGTEKENELGKSFTEELPGSALTIEGREHVAKPRISQTLGTGVVLGEPGRA